jgi:hypothetical protein
MVWQARRPFASDRDDQFDPDANVDLQLQDPPHRRCRHVDPLEERTRKLGASSEINSISGKRLRLSMGLKRTPAKIPVRFRTA